MFCGVLAWCQLAFFPCPPLRNWRARGLGGGLLELEHEGGDLFLEGREVLLDHFPGFNLFSLGLFDLSLEGGLVGLEALVHVLEKGGFLPGLLVLALEGDQALGKLFALLLEGSKEVRSSRILVGLLLLLKAQVPPDFFQSALIVGPLLLELALEKGVVLRGESLQLSVDDLSLLDVAESGGEGSLQVVVIVVGVVSLDEFSVLLVLEEAVDVSLARKVPDVLGFRVEGVGVEAFVVVLARMAGGEAVRLGAGVGDWEAGAGGEGGDGGGSPDAGDDAANEADVVPLGGPAGVALAEGLVEARVVIATNGAGRILPLQEAVEVEGVVADGRQDGGLFVSILRIEENVFEADGTVGVLSHRMGSLGGDLADAFLCGGGIWEGATGFLGRGKKGVEKGEAVLALEGHHPMATAGDSLIEKGVGPPIQVLDQDVRVLFAGQMHQH